MKEKLTDHENAASDDGRIEMAIDDRSTHICSGELKQYATPVRMSPSSK